MRYLAVFFLALMTAAPASGQTSDSTGRAETSDAADMIAYSETGPNGDGLVHWYLRPGGEGRYQSKARARKGVDIVLSVSPAGFRKIATLLAPLETRRETRCRESIDDRATGKLSWTRGDQSVTLHLDQGCIADPGETALMALDEANSLILFWARTGRWDADTRFERIITCGPRQR